MQIMTLYKLLLTFYPNLKPFFTSKQGKNQLTFLSMVGVDPPLSFASLLLLLLPKSDPAIKTKLCMHDIDLLEG
jgi:hypothetical protein